MKLSTSLVAVRKISSTVPRSSFADDELEQIAKLILAVEGIINPIILHKTSLESYEVVDGHFEYYAAARAREIDLRRGEMIGAYIIEPDNEEIIKEQVKLLRRQKLLPGLDGIEARLTNIESRFENRISELKIEQVREIKKIEKQIQEVESRLTKQLAPLEAFNTLSLSDLTFRLRSAGFTEQTAAKVAESVESERQKKNFESLNDVVARIKIKSGKKEVKGISSDKMIAIIDSWSQLLFS